MTGGGGYHKCSTNPYINVFGYIEIFKHCEKGSLDYIAVLSHRASLLTPLVRSGSTGNLEPVEQQLQMATKHLTQPLRGSNTTL